MNARNLTVTSAPWRALMLGSALSLCAATVQGGDVGDPCVPEWSAGVGAGEFGMVVAIATLDDGDAVNHFIASNGVAQWTGEAWTQLGDEQLLAVRALTIFDDGDGPALYAGPEASFLESGQHSGVVRWDGTQWLAVGDGPGVFGAAVNAMLVFDDGTGPALYASGFFVGGPPERISRWDGRTWTPLTGAIGTLTAVNVRTITAFDDGTGAAIYAGGNALAVNGVPTPIAKWDGSNWSAVPGLPQADNTVVIAMTVHDDGNGPALYVGGFSSPSFAVLPVVSRFDGTEWSVVATPFNGSVQALASFDDGTGAGPALFVGGGFTSTATESGNQPIAGIGRLNGTQWEQVDAGTNGGVFVLHPSVDITGGGAPALHVGGSFGSASGVPSANFAEWAGCVGTSVLPGDVNADGIVDGADLGLLLAQWGPCDACDDCLADIIEDCIVDGADLGVLLANWSSNGD